MRVQNFLAAAGAALLVAGAAASAHAAIVYPVSATGSSNYPSFSGGDAIDQGGNFLLTDWASFEEGAHATLNMDLGALYTLVDAYVTDRVSSGGFNGSFVGGLSDFTTKFSLQGFTDATFTTALGAALVFNHAAPISPNDPSDFQYVASLGGLTTQFVQYKVLAANGLNTGLSDIHFDGVAVVPEPAAWALMIIGFGASGAMLRRRRAPVPVRA